MEHVGNKTIVIVVGLILITLGVTWLMHRIEAYQQLHSPVKTLDSSRELEDELADDGIEGFWGPPEWIFSIFHEFQTLIAQIGTYTIMTMMITTYALVVGLMSNIAIGVFNHFICGGKWFVAGLENSVQALFILMLCAMEKMESIATGDCLRFYIVDIIFGLIFFVGSAVLSIIWTITGVDLQPILSLGWNLTVVPLDSLIFAITGKYITRWSDSTYERCYKCTSKDFAPNGDRSKTPSEGYSLSMQGWTAVMKCGGDEMKRGMYKMITAIIPSRKWGAWSEEKHQEGWDDEPPFTF